MTNRLKLLFQRKWIRILDIDESIPKDDVFKLILAQNNDKISHTRRSRSRG